MRTLYNILFTICFVLASPRYFWRMCRRGNWQTGFRQRFGKYDSNFKQSITNRHVLWAHAVSVGEVNICTALIRALEPRFPNLKIVVSTTTSTGMGELQSKLPNHIGKIYYPIDYRACVVRALSTINPEAIVLIEGEIWPNFLWRARELRKPIFLVNARLSPRSYRRYKLFRFLFKPLFASFRGVGAQNEADASKLRELGCRPEAIRIVGNLKFGGAALEERPTIDVPGMLAQLGVPQTAKVMIGGSTHKGEEAILAQIFLRLRTRIPELFLVLVPRHFERSREIGRELAQLGIKFCYRSEVTPQTRYAARELDCLLVNTTGELKVFYRQADVVFIGKSLTAEGGQNPIEAGEIGKAMVFGPNMQNFAQVAKMFVERDGAIQVSDAGELEATFSGLLLDDARREQLGTNARSVVKENQGAIERTVEMLVEHLDDGEVYIAPRS